MDPDRRLLPSVGGLGSRPIAFPAARSRRLRLVCRCAAERYGPRGAFWRGRPDLAGERWTPYEIWNEPDVALYWGPAPDAGRYVDLHLRARDAIKIVDPRARVVDGD